MESTAIQPIFDRDGYIALPVFVTRHKLAEIMQEVERFIASQVPQLEPGEAIYDDPDRPETLTQIKQLHERDTYFEQLMADDHFRRVAETVLKGPVVARHSRYYNKPPGANRPTPPHQDCAYFRVTPCEAVELWLALDDADEDTGCMRYVRGSHVDGLLPHQPTGVAGFEQGLVDPSPCDDDRTRVACRVRAGDMLVHHALTIHWTESNQSNHRHRRALGFVYYSEHAREETADTEAKDVEDSGSV